MASTEQTTQATQAPATRIRLIAHQQTDDAHRADQHAAQLERLCTLRTCSGMDCDTDPVTAAVAAGSVLLRQQAIALRKASTESNQLADTLQSIEHFKTSLSAEPRHILGEGAAA